MEDDWSLKDHKLYTDVNHFWNDKYNEKIVKEWYFSNNTIETLRQTLIEDLKQFTWEPGDGVLMKKIINKRFGVEE